MPSLSWKKVFLEILSVTGNVSEAATAVGRNRSTCYRARDRSKTFATQWDEAIEKATDALEREARRRAESGVAEPVYYKGDIIGHIQKYSDTLLIFLLKAHRPRKFRDNVSMEHTGADGGPMECRVKVEWEDFEDNKDLEDTSDTESD